MRAYYLIKQRMVLNVKTIITDDKDNILYLLTNDGIRHSWSLKSYKNEQIHVIFKHGFTQSRIKFKYLDHFYTVKKSAWLPRYIISSETDQEHKYKYLNESYKSHFYINDIEQSYDDEDSNIIATNENDTVFLLLVHLAVYIIMYVKDHMQ